MSRIVVVAVAAIVLASFAPAAHADHWRSTDESSDVAGFSYDPEPSPCGTSTDLDGSGDQNTDIVGLGVRHTGRTVVVTLRFRDLKPALEQQVSVNLRAPAGGFELFLIREPESGGSPDIFVDLSTEPDYPDPDDIPECGTFSVVSEGIPCRIGREVDLRKNFVRMEVPRRCIGNPRWVRVAASASKFVGGEDPEDPTFSIFWDDWDNGGAELSYWLPPFGPRVHATRAADVDGHGAAYATTSERHTIVVIGRDRIFERR